MHQSLHDYFWVYIVVVVVVCGALVYLMPKMTSFLEKVIVGGKMRDAKKPITRKKECETASEKDKNRRERRDESKEE